MMKSQESQHRCIACGYALDGLPAVRCPECGVNVVREAIRLANARVCRSFAYFVGALLVFLYGPLSFFKCQALWMDFSSQWDLMWTMTYGQWSFSIAHMITFAFPFFGALLLASLLVSRRPSWLPLAGVAIVFGAATIHGLLLVYYYFLRF